MQPAAIYDKLNTVQQWGNMIKSAEPEVVQQGDIGTKIRHDRKELELVTDHKGKQKARVRNASVLDELKNHKHITQDQYSA